MWHAARVQEKAIKNMLIDYQKRADRRRVFYEQMKQEPTNFLQLFGRCAKINLDPAIAIAAESPQIMQAWQGNTDIMIDRYDVRSHIDYLTAYNSANDQNIELSEEETRCNYERYRILVQNDSAGVTEDDCLKQIYMDEQFGAISIAPSDNKKSEKKAAIGYVYEESESSIKPAAAAARRSKVSAAAAEEEDENDSSDEDMDLDNILDIDLLTTDQEIYLDKIALNYDIKTLRYSDFLEMDRSEIEDARNARLIEQEKAQYSGRKSRRERRIYKEKKLKDRQISPPSYAAVESRNGSKERCSTSRSRSPIATGGTIEFITSFGGLDSNQLAGHGDHDDDQHAVPHGPFLPGSEEELKHQRRMEEMNKAGDSASAHHSSKQHKHAYSKRSEQSRTKSRRRRSTSSSRSRNRSKSESRRRKYKITNRSRSSSGCSINRSRTRRFKEYRRGIRETRSKSIRRRFKNSRSRSRIKNSRSRNNSRSRVRSRSRNRSRSKKKIQRSLSRDNESSKPKRKSLSSSRSADSVIVARQPSLKRYRRPSLSSHSGLEEDDEDTPPPPVAAAAAAGKQKSTSSNNRCVVAVSKPLVKVDHATSKAKLQEKLNKRIQMTLTKHYAADKRAQMEKHYKEEQQKLDREEDLRCLSLQLRARDLEKKIKEQEDLDLLKQQWRKNRRSRSRSRHRAQRSRSRSSRRLATMRLVDY